MCYEAMRTLRSFINSDCVLRGDFTLASGKKSDIYIDLRKLTLSYKVTQLVDVLRSLLFLDIRVIGGPEAGANQIVGAFMSICGSTLMPHGHEYRGFIVRKKAKDHGVPGLLYGNYKRSDRVALVEDVTTTGETLAHCIDACRKEGLYVAQAITILDRNQGANNVLRGMGVPFLSVFNILDL